MKQNCWEFKKCGREPGGLKADDLGVCPAAVFNQADGFCEGKNSGRACVFLTGTLCGGKVQGNFADKNKNCMECEFYKILKKEYGDKFNIFEFNNFILNKK